MGLRMPMPTVTSRVHLSFLVFCQLVLHFSLQPELLVLLLHLYFTTFSQYLKREWKIDNFKNIFWMEKLFNLVAQQLLASLIPFFTKYKLMANETLFPFGPEDCRDIIFQWDIEYDPILVIIYKPTMAQQIIKCIKQKLLF